MASKYTIDQDVKKHAKSNHWPTDEKYRCAINTIVLINSDITYSSYCIGMMTMEWRSPNAQWTSGIVYETYRLIYHCNGLWGPVISVHAYVDNPSSNPTEVYKFSIKWTIINRKPFISISNYTPTRLILIQTTHNSLNELL